VKFLILIDSIKKTRFECEWLWLSDSNSFRKSEEMVMILRKWTRVVNLSVPGGDGESDRSGCGCRCRGFL